MARTLPALLLALLVLPALAAGEVPPDLDAVRDHLRREMVRTAAAELAEVLAGEPEVPEPWELLAELRLATGDPVAASDAASRAATLDLVSARLWKLWGRCCLEAGLSLAAKEEAADVTGPWFAAAEQGFRKARELDPDDPDVLWRLGHAMEWQGQQGVAAQFYELAVEEAPRHPGGWRRLAQLHLSQDRREEGLATFEQGLEKAGEDGELLYLHGRALEEADREKALECYRRCARAEPGFVRTWRRLAEIGEPAELLYPLAREVLAEHPTALYAAWWAGRLANRRAPAKGEKPWDRNVEALGHLLPALEVYGEHEGLYLEAYQAAQVLFGSDPAKAPDPKRGVEAFERIHEAWIWSGDAANNLGYFFREQRKYEISLDWYLLACERAPENQDILNDTGLIYLFHFPAQKAKGLPYFLKTVALVEEGDQQPERGYWDALENLCKHYWEVDRQPDKVVRYAEMRYRVTKRVKPYNMSRVAEGYAEKAREALGK